MDCPGERAVVLSEGWMYLDLDGPEKGWLSAREKFRRQAIRDSGIAQKLRKDAEDANEQAALHERSAALFTAMVNAMDHGEDLIEEQMKELGYDLKPDTSAA